MTTQITGANREIWEFQRRWGLATLVGLGSGSALYLLLYLIIINTDAIYAVGTTSANIVLGIAFGISYGPAFGVAQRHVLRPYIQQAQWWVAATAAGFVVGFAALLGFSSLGSFAVVDGVGQSALFGSWLGLLQWLVLQGQVNRAGWWVLISAVSWALGAVALGIIGVLFNTAPAALLAILIILVVPNIPAGAALSLLLHTSVGYTYDQS